jgi:hypothetical protein
MKYEILYRCVNNEHNSKFNYFYSKRFRERFPERIKKIEAKNSIEAINELTEWVIHTEGFPRDIVKKIDMRTVSAQEDDLDFRYEYRIEMIR